MRRRKQRQSAKKMQIPSRNTLRDAEIAHTTASNASGFPSFDGEGGMTTQMQRQGDSGLVSDYPTTQEMTAKT